MLEMMQLLEIEELMQHVVTPDATYQNLNLLDYSFRRTTEEGSHITIMELRCEEIRQVQTQVATTPKSSDAVSAYGVGVIQPSTPPTTLNNAIAGIGL